MKSSFKEYLEQCLQNFDRQEARRLLQIPHNTISHEEDMLIYALEVKLMETYNHRDIPAGPEAPNKKGNLT